MVPILLWLGYGDIKSGAILYSLASSSRDNSYRYCYRRLTDVRSCGDVRSRDLEMIFQLGEFFSLFWSVLTEYFF